MKRQTCTIIFYLYQDGNKQNCWMHFSQIEFNYHNFVCINYKRHSNPNILWWHSKTSLKCSISVTNKWQNITCLTSCFTAIILHQLSKIATELFLEHSLLNSSTVLFRLRILTFLSIYFMYRLSLLNNLWEFVVFCHTFQSVMSAKEIWICTDIVSLRWQAWFW